MHTYFLGMTSRRVMQCRITVKFSYISYVIGRDLYIYYIPALYTMCTVTKGHLLQTRIRFRRLHTTKYNVTV